MFTQKLVMTDVSRKNLANIGKKKKIIGQYELKNLDDNGQKNPWPTLAKIFHD